MYTLNDLENFGNQIVFRKEERASLASIWGSMHSEGHFLGCETIYL